MGARPRHRPRALAQCRSHAPRGACSRRPGPADGKRPTPLPHSLLLVEALAGNRLQVPAVALYAT